MSEGYVYILTNKAMPGLVKIGKTTRAPEARAAELYQTGVPLPFEVWASFKTPDCTGLEAMAHEFLQWHRVSDSREFFDVSPEVAKDFVGRAHSCQLGAMIEDYAPDLSLIPSSLALDETGILFLAMECGVSFDVALSAIQTCITVDVMRGLLATLDARKAPPSERCLSLVCEVVAPDIGGVE